MLATRWIYRPVSHFLVSVIGLKPCWATILKDLVEQINIIFLQVWYLVNHFFLPNRYVTSYKQTNTSGQTALRNNCNTISNTHSDKYAQIQEVFLSFRLLTTLVRLWLEKAISESILQSIECLKGCTDLYVKKES